MSDDPTGWFRPRGERRPSDENATPEAHGDEQPPTERMDAAGSGSGDADPDSPVTQPLDPADQPGADATGADETGAGDGLSNLFGDQRDYAGESDWLPPRDPGTDAPTEVQPTAPATDPLGWLGDRGSDDATTVAVGASAAGLGAAAATPPPPDDSVTQRFDAAGLPPLPSIPADGGPPPEEPGSKRLVIALAILGVVLVIALVLALVWFFSGTRPAADSTPKPATSASTSRSASPTPTRTSASPTPTATTAPSPAPTKTTPPTTAPVAAPTIGSFTSSPSTAACESPDATVNLSFSWTTSNAAKVSISIDGVQDPYNDQLSAAGTLSNVPFRCSNSTQGFTLLATNSAGRQTSKQVTVTREESDSGGDSGDGTGGGGTDGGTNG